MFEKSLDTVQTRCFKSLTFRASSQSGEREIEGIGVPYNNEIELAPGVAEVFAPESVEAAGAKLFYGHSEPIGLITHATHTPAGLHIKARISATPKGDEVYTLVKDGVLTRFSIGFQGFGPDSYRIEQKENTELCVWEHVEAKEFSVVPFPAYEEAKITAVRSKQSTTLNKGKIMETEETTPITRAEFDAMNEALDRLERTTASLPVTSNTVSSPTYRSMGHFLKRIASGDEQAISLHERAFSGNTTADTIMKDSFVGAFIKLISQRRRVTEMFTKGALPADGLSVDYYQVNQALFNIEKQASEGENLASGSKISLKEANSKVETIGGFTEISRQAIERATVPLLDTLLTGLGLKYGQVTEGLVRDVYLKFIADNAKNVETSIVLGEDPAKASASQWLDALVDAAELYDLSQFALAGLTVSKDVFKALNNLKDGGNRLMNVSEERNTIGSISIPGLSGQIASIPVHMLPGAPVNTAACFDPVAIKTLEAPGSPAMLQDSNIINLTSQFSLYGYHAVITPFPSAIIAFKKALSA